MRGVDAARRRGSTEKTIRMRPQELSLPRSMWRRIGSNDCTYDEHVWSLYAS